MRENDAGRPRTVWHSNPFLKRITGAAAQVSATILLATGVVGGLAARRNQQNDSGKGDGGNGHDQTRDRDNARDRAGQREDGRLADRQKDGHKSDHSTLDDRGAGKDRVTTSDESDKSRDRNQTADPSTPTPADDTSGGGGGGDGGGGGGGGNRAGNAGSDFFDSPLATKARRRANDFDNSGGDPGDDGVVADVNPEGQSVFETDGISFTTGPQGLEILTGNITYTAAPTPSPTPFPRLELPVREPLFPGNVTTAPTPAAPADAGAVAPAPAPARADPVRADPGDGSVQPMPEAPVPPDTSGGDNTMDFLS